MYQTQGKPTSAGWINHTLFRSNNAVWNHQILFEWSRYGGSNLIQVAQIQHRSNQSSRGMIHEILNDSIKYRSNELNAWLERVTVILWYLYTWYIANAAQFLDLWLQYLSNQPNTCWIDGIQPLQVKHIEYRIEWSNTGCIRLMLGEWIEYRSNQSCAGGSNQVQVEQIKLCLNGSLQEEEQDTAWTDQLISIVSNTGQTNKCRLIKSHTV